MNDILEQRSTRVGFLGKLASTAAVGLGFTLAAATRAKANAQTLGHCCPDTSGCGQSNPCTNALPFKCTDSCPGDPGSCCICDTGHSSCFDITCPCV